MTKINNSRWISYILYGLIIFALVLGSVKLPVSAKNAEQVIEEQILEIDGGESRHFIIDASETLTFKLELKQPTPGAHYIWEIQQLANAGMASVEIFDDWAMVTYLPGQGFSGEDHFLVEVTDGKGSTGQVHVSVSVVPSLPEPNLQEPILEDRLNPGLERMPSLDPLHSSTKQDMLFRSNEIPETRRTPLQPDSDWIDDLIYTETRTPSIVVDLLFWEIYGYWESGSTITLTIDDPGNGVGIDYTETGTAENGWIEFYPAFALEPGQLVTLTDGVVSTTHTIIDLQVTGFNEADDTLTGLANPGLLSLSSEYEDEFGGHIEEVTTTANSEGVWQATFEMVEIEPGTYGWISQSDTEGNSTNNWFQIPNPRIIVYPEQDEIRGRGWIPLTMVELRIDEVFIGSVLTESGTVDFVNLPDVKPGQTVVMTDGTFTRTHTVTDVAITEIDIEDNAVRGTADAGSVIWLSAHDDYNGDLLEVTTDQLGVWEAQFTQVVLMPGVDGAVSQGDEQGNSTVIFWSIPDPYIRVYPLWDNIYSYRWTPMTNITLKIDDVVVSNLVSDYDGDAYFYNLPVDITSGSKIEMSDEIYTRVYTVTNLAVTQIDQAANTVRGTATPGALLEVTGSDESNWDSLQVTTNSSGLWEAIFTTVQFAPGTYGYVYQYDEIGNATVINWRIPDPYIYAYPEWDRVEGRDWPPSSSVELRIDTVLIASEIADEDGWVGFYDLPDVNPGQTINMTDGTYTRTHTVTNVAITEIDIEDNAVRGTAVPDSKLGMEAGDGSNWEWLDLTANSLGVWEALLTEVELIPGAYGYVHQPDEDGNRTLVYWDIPNPYMQVYPLGDYLQGYDWTPNTEVTITIGINTWTATADTSGWFYKSLSPFDIQPSQIVVITDGTYTRTHTVSTVAVTEIDQALDIVRGTAAPASTMSVYAKDGGNYKWFYPTADSSGNWSANFTGFINLEPGVTGWVYQYDEQGNSTRINWYVPDPRFWVYPLYDQVQGFQWLPNRQITITVGSNTWTTLSDSNGRFSYYLSFDLQPGQLVQVTDGTDTRTHTIGNVAVTSINEATDIVSGTADPGSDVFIEAHNVAKDEHDTLDLVADGSGRWSANFSGLVDIAPSVWGMVFQNDENNNATAVRWNVPNPIIEVYPQRDSISGFEWSLDTTVTLTIGANSWSETSNASGHVYFDDLPINIVPGMIVSMTDGTYTRTHTVRNITVTEVNAETNLIRGTAQANSEVIIVAGIGNTLYNFLIQVDSTGHWQSDFGGFDIAPDQNGSVLQEDLEGNLTVIDWYIIDPCMHVYPHADSIYGYGWPADTNVTITIASNTWIATSGYSGSFYLNLGAFDLLPGQTVQMTGGTYTINYVVRNVQMTYDISTDKVSGVGDPNSKVEVFAWEGSRGYILSTLTDSTGAWEIDFSGTVDISPGTDGYVYQYDIQFNSTGLYWFVPDPYFVVDPLEDVVYGYGWPANTLVTLEIGTEATPTTSLLSNRATWTEESDYQGFVEFKLDTYDIQAGEVVTMSGGTYTQTHTVAALEITEIDEAADTITGTAEAGSTVEVYAEKWSDSDLLSVVVDGDGIWIAEFDGLVDIGPGASGFARQYDELENATIINWSIEGDYMIFLPLILK